MNIRDILQKHYQEFADMCTKTDIAIYGGRTSEDLLNDAMITTINHYRDEDVDEDEGFEYAKKTFLFNEVFAYKKKVSEDEQRIVLWTHFPKVDFSTALFKRSRNFLLGPLTKCLL